MSSLSINSVTNPYQTYGQGAASQAQQSNFQTLANALQSGNLSAAQTAFTALQQQFQNQSGQSTSTSQSGQTNPVSSDVQSLSSALQSGNLTSARAGLRPVAEGHAKPANQRPSSPSPWRRRCRRAGGAVLDLVTLVELEQLFQHEQHGQHAERHGVTERKA